MEPEADDTNTDETPETTAVELLLRGEKLIFESVRVRDRVNRALDANPHPKSDDEE